MSAPSRVTGPLRNTPPLRRTQPLRAVALSAVIALTVAGCGFFGGDGEAVDVFDVTPGECFLSPEEITAELSELTRVDCEEPHHQEAYAVVDYTDAAEDAYPGDAGLKDFADGACATEFADYVGVDYRDSTLFFTYLLPSPRSWEQAEDRSITCFITTAGELLEASMQGSEL